MTNRRFTLLSVFITLACETRPSTSDVDNRPPQPAAIGTRSSVVNVRLLKGEEIARLARAYGEKGTVFNIWATWCGSCRGEMPKLRSLDQDYGPRGVHVVLVSVDEAEQFDQLMDRISSLGLRTPAWVAMKPLGAFKTALAKNWLGNIPVSFLYDSRGQRRYFWNGPIEINEVKPILDGFLAGQTIDGETQYELSAGALDTNTTQAHAPAN